MHISLRRALACTIGPLLAASALVAVTSTGAQASQIAPAGSQIYYEGQGSENNVVTVGYTGSSYTITDTGGVTISPYPGYTGCTIAGSTATCPASGVTYITVSAGAGNDQVTIQANVPARVYLYGGDGDDTLRVLSEGQDDYLTGDAGTDTLSSGSGNDTIYGGAGNDLLNSGAGDDSLSGDDGADKLVAGDGNDTLDPGVGIFDEVSGGNGKDTVNYYRGGPVNVSLDGLENDGESGESDNVDATVEVINTGSGNDTLTGTAGTQTLNGGDGNDTINGGDGNDKLRGNNGNDVLNGGAGDDRLDGGSGADTYAGGSGSDYTAYATDQDVTATLNNVADDGVPGEGDNLRSDMEEIVTGSGDDTVVGTNADNEFWTGDGNDTVTANGGSDGIYAGQGRDRINAGSGIDSVYGDGGADTITVKDSSKDYVTCGGSVDTVTRNSGDQLTVDCEKVK